MGKALGRDRPRDEQADVRERDASSPRRDAAHDPFADLGLDEAAVAEVRKAVQDRLSSAFRGSVSEHDIEDATQTAWVALLNEHLKTPVKDKRAFAAKVGMRVAVDLQRRAPALPIDPIQSPLLEKEDPTASVIERIDDRAQVARIVEALEQLDDDKLAAFHLRIIEDLPHEEACERLRLGRSAYFERVRAALAQVEGAVEPTSHVFQRRQRQLLSDYVAGIAVGRSRARAERLIAADPRAATLARELRRTHDSAAIVLPTLGFVAAVEQDPGGRLTAVVDRVRELMAGWHGRGADAADLASSPLIASGGARGAGAAGVGVLAKAFGGLGAGNIAAGCLGGGAVATIACVATGVLPLPGSGESEHTRAPETDTHRTAPNRAARQVRLPDLVAAEPAAPTAKRPETNAEPADSGQPTGQAAEPSPTPAPESTLEPSVSPEVQEFGVAGAGTPVGGASPDTNDANGASASRVRQEFGP